MNRQHKLGKVLPLFSTSVCSVVYRINGTLCQRQTDIDTVDYASCGLCQQVHSGYKINGRCGAEGWTNLYIDLLGLCDIQLCPFRQRFYLIVVVDLCQFHSLSVQHRDSDHTMQHMPKQTALCARSVGLEIHHIYKSMCTPLQMSGFGYFSHTRCWQVYKIKHTSMQSP